MSGLIPLFRKQLAESRWLLGLSCAALFGLAWLNVYRVTRLESFLNDTEPGRGGMRMQAMIRGFGGPSMDGSSAALEAITLYFLSLFVPVILVCLWSISRGSAAVAGDLERGAMDLILSRPVARATYLTSQILCALAGLALMVGAILAGSAVGHVIYKVATPPTFLNIARPAINLAMIGVAILGYCTLLSAIDIVRWRPLLFGSVVTLSQFVAFAFANQPESDDYKWLNHLTVLSAFYPIESAVKGEKLAYNSMVLGGIGLSALALAYLGFAYRDLPANS